MPKRHLSLILLLISAAVLLMAYQGRKGRPLRPLGFVPGLMHTVNDRVDRTGESFRRISSLLTTGPEDIAALKEEIDRLKSENQRLTEETIEAGRLRGLLSLRERQSGYITTARVVSRGSEPWSNIVTIDKGEKDLIRKDMVAVTANGLAGKVDEVYDYYATVILIDDARFRAGARLQASRVEGIFSGRGSVPGRLDFVRGGAPVKVGEIVITSGLDGLFPPGLSIGYVSKVSSKDRLFQEIAVSPFVDTRRLEEVAVLAR